MAPIIERPVIAVLGSLNVDLVSYVSRHPAPGETMISNHFETACGGKGANQAVACAKLSRSPSLADPEVDVFMIGAVGDDEYGALLVDSLTSSGVDISRISVGNSTPAKTNGSKATSPSGTGTAVIIVDESTAQNRIMLFPGANNQVSSTHAAQLTDLSASAAKPSLMILQMEIPLATNLDAIQRAKDLGIPVLVNPAPAQHLPSEAYQGLTHLIMNETEAALLSGTSEEDLTSLPSLGTIAKQFINKGVEHVVITLGARGVFYMVAGGNSGFVPAVKVAAVDTTAAGDTFIGSYAVAFVECVVRGKFDIEKAIRGAVRASAKTVSRKGAQVSIPWRDELAEEVITK